MWELPTYIRDGVHLSIVEVEMVIRSICHDQKSIRQAERFIYSRLTHFEIESRKGRLNDYEHSAYLDWKEVANYFSVYKLSFEREFYRKKLW